MQRRRRWLSRRTTGAFLRRCRDALYPLRDASLALPREVCLAWIRLLPVVRGVYTSRTIARRNVLKPGNRGAIWPVKKRHRRREILDVFSGERAFVPLSPLRAFLPRIDAFSYRHQRYWSKFLFYINSANSANSEFDRQSENLETTL